MNTQRTHRFAALALSAVMTFAMLAGVDGLASRDGAADLMARATQPARA